MYLSTHSVFLFVKCGADKKLIKFCAYLRTIKCLSVLCVYILNCITEDNPKMETFKLNRFFPKIIFIKKSCFYLRLHFVLAHIAFLLDVIIIVLFWSIINYYYFIFICNTFITHVKKLQ